MAKTILEYAGLEPFMDNTKPDIGRSYYDFLLKRNNAIDNAIKKHILDKHSFELIEQEGTNVEQFFIDNKKVLSIDKNNRDIIEIK